jgi:hypothetical protein
MYRVRIGLVEVFRMMFFTHVQIGQFLYEQITQQEMERFELKRRAFIYGNVKPDITKMVFMKHQFAHTYDLFCDHVNIVMDDSQTDAERSVALGVVSHFLCDFFCKVHAKKPYNECSLWKHFWYEWELHSAVRQDLFGRDFSERQYILDPQEPPRSLPGTSAKTIGDEGNSEGNYLYLVELLHRYYEKEESFDTDKDFAFYAINKTFAKIIGREIFLIKDKDRQGISDYPESGKVAEWPNGKIVV